MALRRSALFCMVTALILQGVGNFDRVYAREVITARPDDPRVVRALRAMDAARRFGVRPAPRDPGVEPQSPGRPVDGSDGRAGGHPGPLGPIGWDPYAGAWGMDEATHLLHRGTIGPRIEEIVAARNAGLNGAVATLLAAQSAPTPPGPWVSEPPPDWEHMTDEEIQTLVDNYLDRQEKIKLWWVEQIVHRPASLREPMVLFWHDHFATGAETVFFPQAIYGQLDLFRNQAVGNFKALTLSICTDPAMLIWLNGDGNTVDSPNENFARELMELFTMGEGSGYTQQDVEEAARACTGYVTDGVNVYFIPEWHDSDPKTILGQTGNWGMTELVNILFQQPATARYLCGKLYRWFVDDEAAPEDVEALAATMRAANYNVAPVLQQIFQSAHFNDPMFRGSLIKDGVDLYAGQVRALHATGFDPMTSTTEYEKYWVLWQMWNIGQILTQPPNVAGWPGGRHWINTATLPIRKEYSGMIVEGEIWGWPLGFQVDPLAEANRCASPNNPGALVDDLSRVLLGAPPTAAVRQMMINELLQGMTPAEWSTNLPDAADHVKALLHFALRLPDAQLK